MPYDSAKQAPDGKKEDRKFKSTKEVIRELTEKGIIGNGSLVSRRVRKDVSTRPTAILFMEERQEAVKLRKEGYSFRDIAEIMSIEVQRAHSLVNSALEELVELTKDDLDFVRFLELERLDDMYKGIASDANSGDLDAIDRVIKIMERRAKFSGLDAASKSEVTGKDGQPIEVVDPRELLNSRLAELSSRSGESGSGEQPEPGGSGQPS